MCLILHPFQSIFKLVTLGSLLRRKISKPLDWILRSSCSYQTGVNQQLLLPYLITRMCSGCLITTTLSQHHHNTTQTLHIQCTITTHPLCNHYTLTTLHHNHNNHNLFWCAVFDEYIPPVKIFYFGDIYVQCTIQYFDERGSRLQYLEERVYEV